MQLATTPKRISAGAYNNYDESFYLKKKKKSFVVIKTFIMIVIGIIVK